MARKTKIDTSSEAYKLGQDAYDRGVKSAPALDANIKPLIAKLSPDTKAVIRALDEWSAGWFQRYWQVQRAA